MPLRLASSCESWGLLHWLNQRENLGLTLRPEQVIEKDRLQETVPLYQRALRIREQAQGSEHPDVAYLLNGLANLSGNLGRSQQAELLYQRALRIREQTLEWQHSDITEILHNFAAFREAQGNFQEATSLYQQALTIREQVFGSEHQKTVETRNAYTQLLRKIERVEQAAV